MVFGILGPLVVREDMSAGRSQRARLLGVLLLERDVVVPTTGLGYWVLGEARSWDAEQMHVLVARTRRFLRDKELPATIVTVPGGYRLAAEANGIDATRFKVLVSEAREAIGINARSARRQLNEALSLWRGSVLAGLGLDDHPEVLRLEELRLLALELGFGLDLTLGRHEALPDLLAACRRYPGRERLHVVGLAALFFAGRQSEALGLYHRARAHLVGDLGVEPGTELSAANLAVLRRDPSALLDLVAGWFGDEFATQRKDWSRPTAVVPASPTPARSVGLPRFSTSFVGRTRELDVVRSSVARPGVVTLLGPGGIGKTRLACEVLGSSSGETVRPLWYCDLASQPGRSVPRLVAASLGARLEVGSDPSDAIAFGLRDVNGTIFLDSCELRVEEVADLAQRLRRVCPQLTLLATTRRPLGIDDEVICRVPPLDVETEAVELYCHRAQDADREFVLDVDMLDALRDLCQRLDGLPLAVELAAARIRTVGPAEFLKDIEQRFELLRSDHTGTPSRHRSLTATIESSYRSLSSIAQQVLRRLSVFASPAQLNDVLSVFADDHLPAEALLEALGELVDHSVVSTTRREGRTYYRLLDTIRAYAVHHEGQESELASLRHRHAKRYAEEMRLVQQDLRGPGEVAALARLDEMWPEVAAAVEWSLQAREIDSAVPLLAGLGFEAVFRERGEVVDWVNSALSLESAREHPMSDELFGTGGLADWGYGYFERGLQRALEGVALHSERATRITPDVAAALPLHVSLRGDLDQTIALLNHHAAEAQGAGVPFAQTHMLICIAMALGFAGRSEEADVAMDRADDMAGQLGCRLLQTIAAFTRTIVVLDRRPDEALGHARRTLDLATEIRATWFLSAGSNYLVAALARTEDPSSALAYLRTTFERQLAGGTIQSVANTVRNTIVVLDRLGASPRAVPLIGWLAVNRPSIPGTPGMRGYAEVLANRLRAMMAVDVFEIARARGATLSPAEAIQYALSELPPGGERGTNTAY